MATQFASLQSSRRFPTHPTRRKREHERLLRRANQLFDLIGIHCDACSVEELGVLRDYLDMFLELPSDVLREWDES